MYNCLHNKTILTNVSTQTDKRLNCERTAQCDGLLEREAFATAVNVEVQVGLPTSDESRDCGLSITNPVVNGVNVDFASNPSVSPPNPCEETPIDDICMKQTNCTAKLTNPNSSDTDITKRILVLGDRNMRYVTGLFRSSAQHNKVASCKGCCQLFYI
ncbi:hypothetical protein QE152_g5362 [Popillia japonica]|uniref:Uncharacterized protein n=1 Tax=Popillia japonica TaxID=7064 RepID=A0AAW1MQ65_POPJA